jgi:hypothetical protein
MTTTDQVRILNGNTFVVSDDCGDIEASSTDFEVKDALQKKGAYTTQVEDRKLIQLPARDLCLSDRHLSLGSLRSRS